MPIPRPENSAPYQRYRTLADARAKVTFVGRLAQYRYYNMDQAVGAAMTAAERVMAALAAARAPRTQDAGRMSCRRHAYVRPQRY